MRLEVRHGSARPVTHEVSDVGFLIGSVPGCDLRLPGTNLPPVLCLIVRYAGGVGIRKLAPVLPILVNGRSVSTGPLLDGDRVSIGPVDLLIHVAASSGVQPASAAPVHEPVAPGRLTDQEARAAELERVRGELDDLRQKLYERYRERRDRLAALRLAVGRAARKVQERKRQADAVALRLDEEQKRVEARRSELEGQAAELASEDWRVAEERRQLDERLEVEKRDQESRSAELRDRERQLAADRKKVEEGQAQHQTDLVRLDRLRATLDQRQQQLQERALEVDRRYEQLQRDTRELEEQAAELDAGQTRLQGEADEVGRRKNEQEVAAARLTQRIGAVEGQQAMLATLRTRLERMREDQRREEQQLALQRAKQQEAEADLQRRLQDAQRLRTELDGEKQLRGEERRRFEERSRVLETAVAQLRQTQQAVSEEEERLRQRKEALDAAAASQAEEAALLRARTGQLLETQQRLEADRQALKQREAALAQAEQAREALQEQLRRRSEELAARQRALADQDKQREEDGAALQACRAEIDRERQQAHEQLAARQQDVERRTLELEQQRAELERREETLRRHVEQLKEAGRRLGQQRKALAQERDQWQAGQLQVTEQAAKVRTEAEAVRAEAAEQLRQLPELEARAQEAADRLTLARDQLREHLAEVHAYARESREGLEVLRGQVQAEADRLRQQELALHRDRDEHRLAVASFRQQLIEWQGQVAEMKRLLAQGEDRLGRRQAEVDEQARRIDATSARLARQAEELVEQERQVSERRTEIERHLADMREWYRRKLRELSQGHDTSTEVNELLEPAAQEPSAPDRDIISLTGDVEPADRKLGELLRSLELVDAETLGALLVEARKQRRSLRQVLLAGGCLTLYQMALIEAGNVDGLVLGPLRVIDRLRATPRETVYRVFDPRRGKEAVLRHLAEAEMNNAVHPDEFRQRYAAAAAVPHPHLAATLEVLEIAGRPAALLEAVAGLPSADWPALVAVLGVWFRLVSQAALGLHTAHQAGLFHGRLDAGSVRLTPEGIVKLCNFGEPPWLAVPPVPDGQDGDAATDLVALGTLAASWAAAAPSKGKIKSMPESLQAVLRRLTAESADERYPSAAVLLEDLDRAGADVPANAAAWERLLKQVREEAADTVLRESA